MSEYIVTLKARIVDLQGEVVRLKEQLEYTNACLHSLLTGDMPEVADLNQTLFAVRGRKYLNAIERLKTLEGTLEGDNDSKSIQRKGSCLEASDRNSDRH